MNIILTFFYSLYFNFRYLKPHIALRLPVLIHWRTEIKSFSGTIEFKEPSLFCLRIGIGSVGFNRRSDSCLIKNDGRMVIIGKASLGLGTEICNDGILTFGNGFNISASSRIICQNAIKFGDNCLMSWGCQLMDTDFHKVLKGKRRNKENNPSIEVLSNVWIGNSVYIYKGVTLGEGNIISSNSVIKRSFIDSNCIISSQGGEVLKLSENIAWEF